MKRLLPFVVAALVAASHPQAVVASPAEAIVSAGTVKVTVNYKGKGTVDASHKLWVWVFDTPNIGPGSMPIGQVALDRNGAEAVFENIAGDTVYIAAAFDEQGVMTGDAPPPAGSPIGIFSGANGAPAAVTPGGKPAALAFDDSVRMP